MGCNSAKNIVNPKFAAASPQTEHTSNKQVTAETTAKASPQSEHASNKQITAETPAKAETPSNGTLLPQAGSELEHGRLKIHPNLSPKPDVNLILTSNGLSSPALQHAFINMLGGADLSKKTGWFIPTAQQGWSEEQGRKYMQSIQQAFGVGRLEWIDVQSVKGDALKQAVTNLGKVDFVWLEQGNTYNLAYHLWDSGGAQLVKALVEGGSLYIGNSAGAIMAGRTIQTAFWKDWDDKTCAGTVDLDWSQHENARGLDLVGSRSIFPHASGQFANTSWQREQAKKHGHTDHEVLAVPDLQGIIISGNLVQFV